MNYFCDVNIGKINIIVKKQEREEFVFKNEGRLVSGFVCFIEGDGYIDVGGEGRYPIRNGTFISFRSGDRYEFKVAPNCSYITSECEIEPSDSAVLPRTLVCTLSEREELLRICELFLEQGEFCYLETRIALLRFYSELLQRLRKQAGEQPPIISGALSYIHKHYNENFSLEDVAAFCNVSLSHLRNSFHAETKTTVMQYRETLRIKRAKTMLKSGEFRIKEIADSLGYCDVYHFSKRFKQATGSSPAEYIRTTRKKSE